MFFKNQECSECSSESISLFAYLGRVGWGSGGSSEMVSRRRLVLKGGNSEAAPQGLKQCIWALTASLSFILHILGFPGEPVVGTMGWGYKSLHTARYQGWQTAH